MKRPLFHHHKHTGKLIHHRHTSYPVLVALLLVVGGLIFMTDRVAQADDLLVTATVPAPIPNGAPVFTQPQDGTVVATPTVAFSGTCPVITPAVIIGLYEGTTLLGSGLCQSDGTFAVSASLTSGTHAIIATVTTITGDNGDSSSPLHVTYTPPTPAVTPAAPNTATPATPSHDITVPTRQAIAPLDIISEQLFSTFKNDYKTTWRGHFAGGVPPYTVTVQWGDTSSNTYSVNSNDEQVFTHQYSRNLLYPLSVTVRDQSGLQLTRNFIALHASGAPVATTTPSIAGLLDNTSADPYLSTIIVYLCLLLMLLMMWRFEHVYYPYRIIGVPIHYSWQKAAKRRRQPHAKKQA